MVEDNVGDCKCPEYFEGKTCEQILCANRGIANAERTQCHCPDNNRYYGLPFPIRLTDFEQLAFPGIHCERTRCDNNGKDTGDGRCNCIDDWYTGDFCQHFSSPWGVVFGVAGAVLLLLVIVCVVCRIKPCCAPGSRRRPASRPPPPSAPPPRAMATRAAASAPRLPPPYPPQSDPKPGIPPPSYYDVVADLDKYPATNPNAPPPPPEAPPLASAQPLLGHNPRVLANPLALHCDERRDYDDLA